MNRTASWALFILLAINTMNFFDRQILGAVAEPVRIEFELDDARMGMLGTAFTLLYALVGVPLGRLSDHWSRKKLLSIGVLVWSLLTAASGMVRTFGQLFMVRLGVGVGEATCAPAATSLIGDLFSPQTRGRAMSVFMMGLPLGIGLSFLVSTTIAREFGWRTAFFVAGLPGLICAVLVLTLRDPPRGSAEVTAIASEKPAGSPYLTVLAIPTVWWLILSGALHNFNMYALGAFLAPLLQRFHGMDISGAGKVAMFAYGLSGIPGLLLGGLAADYLRKRRVEGRLLVGGVSILLAIPLTYFALTSPTGETTRLMLLLGLGCALMYVYYAAVYPTLHDVVIPQFRGTAMALYFFAMYVLGASLGPFVMGYASDRFARQAAASAGIVDQATKDLPAIYRAEGLRDAMLLVPILNVGLALVLFAGCFTIGRDVMRMHQRPAALPKEEPASV